MYGYGGVESNTYIGGDGADTYPGSGDDIDTVNAGAGDDVIDPVTARANIFERNGGNDTITGGSGEDRSRPVTAMTRSLRCGHGQRATARSATTSFRRADDDVLYGGPDNDDSSTAAPRRDAARGRGGVDTVTYARRTEPITIKERRQIHRRRCLRRSSRPGDEMSSDYVSYDNEMLVAARAADPFSIGSTYRSAPATLDGGAGNERW